MLIQTDDPARRDSFYSDPKIEPIEVCILMLPTMHSSAMYGAYDIFCSAGIRWDKRLEKLHGERRLRIRLVAVDEAPVICWNGICVTPENSIAEIQGCDLVFVPALGAPDEPLPTTDPRVCDWLERMYAGGAMIASACSGSIVLAEAGLLHDQPATTHWVYVNFFNSRFPATRLCPERALVLAGPDQRIVTAGGGSLWAELVLYLVARLLGRDIAMHTAKLYLLDWGREDQLPYAFFQQRLQHSDALIRKAQTYITDHATEADVLVRAREQTGLNQRTFERRFKAVTGVAIGRYIQEVRIEMARELIEQGSARLDDIAFAVGYSDPASFRRLFKRLVGQPPGVYQRRVTPPV